jgi:hypothetical protein
VNELGREYAAALLRFLDLHGVGRASAAELCSGPELRHVRLLASRFELVVGNDKEAKREYVEANAPTLPRNARMAWGDCRNVDLRAHSPGGFDVCAFCWPEAPYYRWFAERLRDRMDALAEGGFALLVANVSEPNEACPESLCGFFRGWMDKDGQPFVTGEGIADELERLGFSIRARARIPVDTAIEGSYRGHLAGRQPSECAYPDAIAFLLTTR